MGLVLILILSAFLFFKENKPVSSPLLENFEKGNRAVFSTKDQPNNYSINLSFEYPSDYFELNESDSSKFNLISYEEPIFRKFFINIVEMAEEYFSLSEDQKNDFIYSNKIIERLFLADSFQRIKMQKSFFNKNPLILTIEKESNYLLLFTYTFILKEGYLVSLCYLVKDMENENVTHYLKEEEAFFKAICDTIKLEINN